MNAHIKELIHKIHARSYDGVSKSLEEFSPKRKINVRRIRFVGMRFYGGHEFTADDVVKLEKDDDGDIHPSAIKVMLLRKDEWEHVAYVNRENAIWLRTIDGFEKMGLTFIETTYRTGVYSIDLKLLQKMGIQVKAKKDVLGSRCGSWYKYYFDKNFDHPDIDYRWA